MRSRWRSSASTCADQKRRKSVQPLVDFLEWLGSDAIHATLRIHARLHEAGLSEHAEMFRDRGLRHPKLVLDLADGSLGRGEETENGAAVRFGDDAKGRFHGSYIPSQVYTCQAMSRVEGASCESNASVKRECRAGEVNRYHLPILPCRSVADDIDAEWQHGCVHHRCHGAGEMCFLARPRWRTMCAQIRSCPYPAPPASDAVPPSSARA